MSILPAAVWEVWVLCFWWSAWTLADQFLIPFHPWAEIGGLAVCAAVWVAFVFRRGMPQKYARTVEATVTAELSNFTQTNAGPYAMQCEKV